MTPEIIAFWTDVVRNKKQIGLRMQPRGSTAKALDLTLEESAEMEEQTSRECWRNG